MNRWSACGTQPGLQPDLRQKPSRPVNFISHRIGVLRAQKVPEGVFAMPKRYKFIKTCLVSLFVTFSAGSAYATGGILLNCDRYDGGKEAQIYINAEEGYVVYNAQLRSANYERKRKYSVVGGKEGETTTIDDGLTISVNTDAFIQASDRTSSFIFVKATATYAHAWTTLLPTGNDKFIAFGNHHEGKCSVNPFVQPK